MEKFIENIGDYIVPIIIVFSFIYSFVKGAKKKKEAEKSIPSEIPQGDMSVPQVKPQSQFQSKRRAQNVFEIIPEREEAFNPVVERAVPSSIQIGEISDESRLDIDFADSEELKKGIIFAEIFNRKY